jgi:hypothetical protein
MSPPAVAQRIRPDPFEALEAAVDVAIDVCDGDVRAALGATLVANAYLDVESQRLMASRVKCNTVDEWQEAHRNPPLSCHSAHELDLKSLVWTRGAVPINELKARLRCPACGGREILIYWEIPNEPAYGREGSYRTSMTIWTSTVIQFCRPQNNVPRNQNVDRNRPRQPCDRQDQIRSKVLRQAR